MQFSNDAKDFCACPLPKLIISFIYITVHFSCSEELNAESWTVERLLDLFGLRAKRSSFSCTNGFGVHDLHERLDGPTAR